MQKTVLLSGTTASGKTDLAFEFAVAHRTRGPQIEIINADSLAIYRGLDIGTAKPNEKQLSQVSHHLINIRDPEQASPPNEVFNAGDFVRLVHETLNVIHAKGNRAIVVGGTGFYLKALLFGMWGEELKTLPEFRAKLEALSNETLYKHLFEKDEATALRVGKNDRYRLIRSLEVIEQSGKNPSELEKIQNKNPDPQFELVITDRESAELEGRIQKRTQTMLAAGLLEETKRLLAKNPNSRALDAVGYAECVRYLRAEVPSGRKPRPGIDGLEDEIVLATRQLVKRQRTWFKGQFPTAKWFQLDRDRAELIAILEKIYS